MPRASLHFDLKDSANTERLGAALARSLPVGSGAVVYLRGELGSGKTTCARSLLHALGITARVRSPTYTLVDTYEIGKLHCAHVDLYRLRCAAEVEELGLREMTGPGCLMLVEWPEKGGAAVPAADVDLLLSYAGDSRVASLRAINEVGCGWLAKLGDDNSLSPYVYNIT